MQSSRRQVLSFLAALPAIPVAAVACECSSDPGLEVAIARAHAILSATLLGGGDRLPPKPGQSIFASLPRRWKVVQVWKGPFRPGDLVSTQASANNCGLLNMEPGDWLLFLDGTTPYELSQCSRQLHFSDAGEVVTVLNKLLGTSR